MSEIDSFSVKINPNTKFIFSTSGSANSIQKHNSALQKLGLDLMYFNFSDPITPMQYAELLKSPISRGGAVTGKDGLKSTIIPFLDEVEPIAKKTLAVNTVINQGGKLLGYNTDAEGLKAALSEGINNSNHTIKTAVIYGNGGVSGVAYHVLKELGIKAVITGRNREKVNSKKRDLEIEDDDFNGPYDLLVDATPISSQADFLKAEGFKELITHCKMVFSHNMPEKDNKQNHLQKYCLEHNLEFIPGSEMYKAQLIRQYKLFIGDISTEQILENWNLEAI
ncbi:shikimate dehydrogenase [Marivirga arenosa]|uniref:Shikimate dehydrogenase n=1 Tax=Marivirga arenosa TaxID=3059076 RepID=A0AA51N6Y1_9BACT|nr:shikimate dehydrogenase [Marivirga sp. ABR2-2]WMN07138.1 shikimate dehydrogenase [Marivirga sp. ABR2-2]